MTKIFSKPVIIGAACTAMVLFGTSAYVWRENQRSPILEIYVIPLKSGQALFIRTPSDKRILVDGGNNSEIIRHISEILPFYSRRIDKVIVTRTDGAHVSGLIDVAERYDIGEIIVPGVSLEDLGLSGASSVEGVSSANALSSTDVANLTDQVYETFIETVKRLKIPLKKVVAGDKLVFDEGDLSTITSITSTSTSSSRTPTSANILFPVVIDTPLIALSSSSASFSANSLSKKFVYSKASAPELVFDISYGSTSVMIIGSVTPKIQKFVVSVSSSTNTISSSKINLDALITSKNPIASNLAPAFLETFSPANIIYSKAMAKGKTSSDMSTMFNIREVGTLKITSNGKVVGIKKTNE